MLAALDQAVIIAVTSDGKHQRLLDAGPIALEKRLIRKHLVFTVSFQDSATLPIGGISPIAPEAHQSGFRVESLAEILHLAGASLKLRE